MPSQDQVMVLDAGALVTGAMRAREFNAPPRRCALQALPGPRRVNAARRKGEDVADN